MKELDSELQAQRQLEQLAGLQSALLALDTSAAGSCNAERRHGTRGSSLITSLMVQHMSCMGQVSSVPRNITKTGIKTSEMKAGIPTDVALLLHHTLLLIH